MRHVTLAAAAYPLDQIVDWEAYAAKIRAWVQGAALRGADLMVFPEYAAMELAALGGAEVAADLDRALAEVLRHRPAMEALIEGLAIEFGLYILAPSGPARQGTETRNRAVLMGPSGRVGAQDKAIMTRFERENWGIDAGRGLTLFETGIGRIGVLICYDSEFPLLARSLCEQGAEILLVPSCTDTVAGYSRVRIGAMARALENQCVVVQAPTVGAAAWCPAIDVNRGAAGIYGPPDTGWPETGVIAEGLMDEPGWISVRVDLDRVLESRAAGAVLPFAHWPEQLLRATQIEIAREKPRTP